MKPSPALAHAPGTPELPDSPFRFIWHFVARYRWWYAAMLVFETANASCGIMIPYALSRIIKAVTSGNGHAVTPGSGGLALATPVALFIGFSVGEVICGRLAGGIQIRLGPRQRQQVTRTLYHYLQYHSHTYFSNNFAGALAHRISETAMGVTQTLWSLITEFWPIFIVFGVSILLLAHTHLQLAAFVGVWAVLFIGISWILARFGQPHAFRAASARSETTGLVVDSVANLTSSRLFARLGFERDYLNLALAKEMKAIRVSNSYSERVRWFQFVAAAVLKIGVLCYALKLWQSAQISVGDFVMVISLALLIINEARNLSRRFLEFFEYVGNVANGVNTIVRPHELVDAPTARSLTIGHGQIEYRDVTFGYNAQKPVFKNLSLTIAAGQRVGLVGFSGSGKSTFVSTLLRLHDLDSGQILIDGVDISTIQQDALHEQLGLIPQDPTLFHRSLRENIRYGRLQASDEEVMQAAAKAHAHEFIQQIAHGYDALVGERGVKLSGGQRQRIAIARVILKNAPILILDEATSSLDSLTERAIQETLDSVMRGKTVLVVAHRLSTIAHLDRILVFDAGRIIEDGSHAELMALKGMYFQLWSKQSDGFLSDAPQTPHAAATVTSRSAHPSPIESHPAEPRVSRYPDQHVLSLTPLPRSLQPNLTHQERSMTTPLNRQALDQLFLNARSIHRFTDRPVAPETLHQLYELLKWGPTGFNAQPGRYLFLTTPEARARLAPALSAGNLEKTRTAPVNVIVAYDSRFHEHLPSQFTAYDAKGFFESAPDGIEPAARTNATLQAGYLVLAARALGLDVGPMSGFKPDLVNQEFFPDGRYKSFLLANIGYGDREGLNPRGPRLPFEAVAEIL